ncbi:MAG: hypothetical protein J5965_05685 [Aeriscardovia sp.]|nr:hypothetical protein [Aeriscardovia sp.]MBR1558178.1 hypothetical protein [Prevotella sp.]
MCLKQGDGCSIRYGREKYDYQEGTVVSFKPGNSFIVPNGQLELRPGDILLTIAQQSMMGTPAKQ